MIFANDYNDKRVKDGRCFLPSVDSAEKNPRYQEFKEKYALHLNQQQERAVLTVEGATLVLAVPGSGKTTVLVARLGHMVINKKIPPENILAVTFTKDAAADMKSRYVKWFQVTGAPGITFCTINALANHIYIEYCRRNNLECRKLIPNSKQLIGSLFRDYDDQEKQIVATAISYIKNMCLTEDQIIDMEELIPNLNSAYKSYSKALAANNQMDYDDQLVYAYEILKSNEQLVNEYHSRYPYICLDEAQDTSLIQHKIIQMLVKDNNIFMVGDEDQSIYGFRGAYPNALLNFKNDYNNPYILRMERNYRSTEQIVSKAQAFISKNKGYYEKNMTAERGLGEVVSLEYVQDRSEQYERLLEIAKCAKTETAFLYRDNESALPIIDLLSRNSIPFRVRKAETNFLNVRVVKDIIAYLTLAVNSMSYDSLNQICNKGILYLRNQQRICAVNACKFDGKSVFDAVDQQMYYVPHWQKNGGTIFRSVLHRVAYSNTYDAINIILDNGYQKYLKENRLDTGKVDIMKILAKKEPNISNFLRRLKELSCIMEEGSWIKDEKSIILSTIHSSKGLEYDTVYMVDVYDGRLPSRKGTDINHSRDSEKNEQEERRLLYVGMTRAKNRLSFFSIANQPSRYIGEMFKKMVCACCGVEDIEEKFCKFIEIKNGVKIGICNECCEEDMSCGRETNA